MDSPLLAMLPEEDRGRVLAAGRRRRFRRSEVVFHEGDPGDTLHLVRSGHVAIRTTTMLGDVATLSVLGPGTSFGELALIGDTPLRSATAVALDPVETLAIHRSDFEDMRRRHPSVDRLLVVLLGERVRVLSDRLQEAYFLPADQRVLRRLAELAALYGDPASEEDVVVPVGQEALATMAGTTRPTANRVLREGEKQGWLALGRGRVEVLDPAVLRRRAGV